MSVREIWKRLRTSPPTFTLRSLEVEGVGHIVNLKLFGDQEALRQTVVVGGREELTTRCHQAVDELRHSELWKTWQTRRQALQQARDEYSGLSTRLESLTEDRIQAELAALVDQGKYAEPTPTEIARVRITETKRIVEGRIGLLQALERSARAALEEEISRKISAIGNESTTRCMERIAELEKELAEAIAPIIGMILRLQAERALSWDERFFSGFPRSALDRAAREADAAN